MLLVIPHATRHGSLPVRGRRIAQQRSGAERYRTFVGTTRTHTNSARATELFFSASRRRLPHPSNA